MLYALFQLIIWDTVGLRILNMVSANCKMEKESKIGPVMPKWQMVTFFQQLTKGNLNCFLVSVFLRKLNNMAIPFFVEGSRCSEIYPYVCLFVPSLIVQNFFMQMIACNHLRQWRGALASFSIWNLQDDLFNTIDCLLDKFVIRNFNKFL